MQTEFADQYMDMRKLHGHKSHHTDGRHPHKVLGRKAGDALKECHHRAGTTARRSDTMEVAMANGKTAPPVFDEV